MNVGWQELVLVFLVLFGSRMPEIGRSLGKGIKSFKDGLSGAGGGDDTGEKVDEYAAPKQADSPDEKKEQETVEKNAGKDAGEEPPQGEHLAG